MRASPEPNPPPRTVLARLDRLVALPFRPATARLILGRPPGPSPVGLPDPGRFDPGWVLARSGAVGRGGDLARLTRASYWASPSPRASEAIERLWRHSVAAAIQAGRMARDSGAADPAATAAAGLLSDLGLWALAAVSPELLADLFDAEPGEARRAILDRGVGLDLVGLGWRAADRLGAAPELADLAWLHAGHLRGVPGDPARFRLVRTACLWADRTPWRLDLGPASESGFEPDPRVLKQLVAEVQVACGAGFFSPGPEPWGPQEIRAQARMRLREARCRAERTAYARAIDDLIRTLPDDVASRAGDPVAAVRPGPPTPEGRRGGVERPARPGSRGRRRRRRLRVAWDRLIRDRRALRDRLEALLAAGRDRRGDREAAARRALLRSLAEFAAGAGHELNNPLAVIQGRAQLLLARTADPEAQANLRAIVGQAQRAHRILRDLMYVARPPAPRPRPCQPAEVTRAALRDLAAEAESRGVRLAFDAGAPSGPAPVDPDALRHLIEVFARNAIEATGPGGTVRVSARSGPDRLEWRFADQGRGLSAEESRHLFDPFYCGRAAGRGLGLGLPRAARFLEVVGGRVGWRANPGGGMTFRVTVPLARPEAGAAPRPEGASPAGP